MCIINFKRTILPVGQGAFYMECLPSKNIIVYDCGPRDKCALIREIDKT